MPPSLFTFPKPPLVHVEAYFWYLKERWRGKRLSEPVQSHISQKTLLWSSVKPFNRTRCILFHLMFFSSITVKTSLLPDVKRLL